METSCAFPNTGPEGSDGPSPSGGWSAKSSSILRTFILPFFVRPGNKVKQPIGSMPGQFQLSVDKLLDELKEPVERGIPAVLLFGIPEKKDPVGSEGYANNGVVQKAVRAIKKAYPDLVVITDVCLCEYTDHGHCGIIVNGDVDNDQTLDLLARMALSHASAGADIVAPSDMMDGRIGAVREALDEGGYEWAAHHVVRGQIRVRILWSVQGRGRIAPQIWGSSILSDGSGQLRRSPPGSGHGR